MEISDVTAEQRLQGSVLYKKRNAAIFNPSLTCIFHIRDYSTCIVKESFNTQDTLNVKKKNVSDIENGC